MKASAFIEILSAAIQEHGDLNLFVEYDGGLEAVEDAIAKSAGPCRTLQVDEGTNWNGSGNGTKVFTLDYPREAWPLL